jgi:hypothetical protein
VLSSGSILSIGSTGSILSIGSAGSILSIGSTGSVLSVGKRKAFLNREAKRSVSGQPGVTTPGVDYGEV